MRHAARVRRLLLSVKLPRGRARAPLMGGQTNPGGLLPLLLSAAPPPSPPIDHSEPQSLPSSVVRPGRPQSMSNVRTTVQWSGLFRSCPNAMLMDSPLP